MDTAEKLLSSLRVPKLFREIITLIGGLGFLIILWELKLRYLKIDFGLNLGRFEIDSVILVISYLTGKSIMIFTDTLDMANDFINYLLVPKKIFSVECWNDIKNFFRYKNLAKLPIKYDEVKQKITTGEVWRALGEHELFEENRERNFQSLMFIRFFFIYLLLTFCYSTSNSIKIYSLVLIIFAIIEYYKSKRYLFTSWLQFQDHIVKEAAKHQEEKNKKM